MAEKDEKFVCASCGEEFDVRTAINECRQCQRMYCDECLNEEGICVPCDEEEQK